MDLSALGRNQAAQLARWPDGHSLFRYETEGFMRLGASLEISPEAAALPELLWLLSFGWYLVVMIQHDQASQAVVIS